MTKSSKKSNYEPVTATAIAIVFVCVIDILACTALFFLERIAILGFPSRL